MGSLISALLGHVSPVWLNFAWLGLRGPKSFTAGPIYPVETRIKINMWLLQTCARLFELRADSYSATA